MNADRPYDLVLFGATGFTGGLTAEYLAEHAPAQTRWALAGRSQVRLEAVRERLAAINPACKDLPLLHADVSHEASISEIAQATPVGITPVGPYIEDGEPPGAGCAPRGADSPR